MFTEGPPWFRKIFYMAKPPTPRRAGRPRKKVAISVTCLSLSTPARERLEYLARSGYTGNLTMCVEKMIEWVPDDFHTRPPVR